MKKVISIMLTVVMLFSMAFSTAVFAESTKYSISIGIDSTATFQRQFTYTGTQAAGTNEFWFDGWPGQAISARNHNTEYPALTGNHIVSAEEGNELALYVRYDISSLAGKQIDSATVGVAPNNNDGNSAKVFSIHSVDVSDWPSTATTSSTEVAPDFEETSLDTYKTPALPWTYASDTSFRKTKGGAGSNYGYLVGTDEEGTTAKNGFDVADAVQTAVDNGETEIAFAIKRVSSGYGTWSQHYYPGLMVYASEKAAVAPTVELSLDKEAYEAGDDIVITATTANVAQGATVSYTFTVNDEAKAGVDNVLTIADAEEGEYVVKVTCNDGTNTFEDTITVTVTESGPVITANSLTGDYLNGYDGKKFSEWTNTVGGYTNTSNFVLDGRTASKKSVYMKFKVDDYKTSNISGARLLISYNGNFDNATMNLYAFDESLWNTETAPTVDRTTKTVEFRTPAKVDGSRVLLSDEYIESGWEYFAYVDLSDAVKTAIVNDQEYFCLVLEPNGTPYGTFYISEVAKPRLQIFTSSNNVPTASLSVSPEQASYLTNDTVTVTANGQDADGDAILTYTFYVNDVEVIDGVDGNVLTLSNLEAGNNVVKVKVTDQWGDYGVATKTLFVKGTPQKTYNTVSDYKFYNSYDGKVFTEYNNVVNHNQTYNYVLNNDTNKLVLFTKFKVSDFANANISSARLLTSMGGNLKGKTIKIYKFDADLWSDTVGPVIDRSESNVVDTVVLPSDAYTGITDNVEANWTYNTQFDVTNAIKDAIANGDEYVCMTIENASGGWSTFGNDSAKSIPRLQVVTTTNNIPTVFVKADKLTYNEGDNVVLTAVGSDKDVDSSLTYKFYVDGVEATEGVNGNKLTISNYDGLEHAVTVKCFDEWNDYGVATITVKKNMAFEISADVSGSIATTLSASYEVTNMDTVNPIDATVIIAVYDASGALYDTQFATSQVGAGATATLGATLTPKTLPEGETFEGYTAQAMIWTSKTLIPLWECVDFE